MINQLRSRVGSTVREFGWKVDENVLWPATDAIQYMPGEDGQAPHEQPSWWQRHAVDLIIAAVLAVVAFLLRHHGLPTDGLWLDDSITGAGLTASPSDLFTVSADHPGFIVTLMAWRDLTGGNDAALTYPALAGGVLGPALLYLGLRWCGYELSISALLAATLAVASSHVVYSGRVRTYTIDLLIVLALALLIPRLTRVRWRWQTGIAWIAAASLLAFWSGFALIAVAVAGLIIVVHPNLDFRLRVVAVAIQEAVCVVLLAVEGHTHNLAAQEDNFRRTWDAFPDFSLNPITFGGEAFVHLRRVGAYFVGGSAWFAGLCILVAVIGLAVAAWKGRQAVRSRYLLLLLLVAFVAGLLGKFPFGPSQGYLASTGGRVSLWLIPVVAFGLAAVLHGLRGILPQRGGRVVFDAAACIAAVVILVASGSRKTVEYPFPGPYSATNFIQSQLTNRDAVLLGYRSNWSFATETDLKTGVEHTPESSIGFQPDYADPRIHYIDVNVDPAHVAPAVSRADRVFVYYSEPPFRSEEATLRTQLSSTLSSLGFRPQPTRAFQDATVQVWIRAGTHPGSVNLTSSDLPDGWQFVSPANPPAGTRILSCLHHLPPAGGSSPVAASGPHDLNLASQIDRWPSPAAASQALSAFGGPAGAACTRSVTQQAFAAAGIPLRFAVNRVRVPSVAGHHAVAYRVVGRDPTGGNAGAQGTLLFFARGNNTVLLAALRGDGKGPFSQALLAHFAATLAKLIEVPR